MEAEGNTDKFQQAIFPSLSYASLIQSQKNRESLNDMDICVFNNGQIRLPYKTDLILVKLKRLNLFRVNARSPCYSTVVGARNSAPHGFVSKGFSYNTSVLVGRDC